jgi:type IV pilus assembly PilO-like protein
VSKLPTGAKAGILAAALVVALATGWFAVIAPKRSEAKKLAAQIAETRAQLVEAQGGAEPQVQPIRVADLFRLSRAMPDRADVPNLLLQLSEISAETGVSFQSITPHDPVLLGSYGQIGIELVFQGHFYDLSDFLYRLRNLVGVHQGVLDATGRLFSVDSISFDEGELLFPQVKATLTVSAYVFGDGTVSSPPPAATDSSQSAVTPSAPANESDSQPIPAAPPGATAARR